MEAAERTRSCAHRGQQARGVRALRTGVETAAVAGMREGGRAVGPVGPGGLECIWRTRAPSWPPREALGGQWGTKKGGVRCDRPPEPGPGVSALGCPSSGPSAGSWGPSPTAHGGTGGLSRRQAARPPRLCPLCPSSRSRGRRHRAVCFPLPAPPPAQSPPGPGPPPGGQTDEGQTAGCSEPRHVAVLGLGRGAHGPWGKVVSGAEALAGAGSGQESQGHDSGGNVPAQEHGGGVGVGGEGGACSSACLDAGSPGGGRGVGETHRPGPLYQPPSSHFNPPALTPLNRTPPSEPGPLLPLRGPSCPNDRNAGPVPCPCPAGRPVTPAWPPAPRPWVGAEPHRACPAPPETTSWPR